MTTYWQHYGMQREPFTADGPSAFSYMPLQWEQQMGLLQHLSWHSQVVLLVTGLSGIGKTTLLNQFVQVVSDKYHVLKLQGNETLGPDQLLKLLSERLGLGAAQQSGVTLQEQVVSQLAVMHSSKQTLLLVVDDAHYLPSATLTLILNLASPKAEIPTALHGVLFGGPQLEANMADITSQHLDEDLTHTVRIEPLNLEATDKYVQQGLHQAGYIQGDSLFEETEIVDIYHASGGIPANINRLVQQALKEKVPPAERKESSVLWSLTWLKTFTALGIFILLSFALYGLMARHPHAVSETGLTGSAVKAGRSDAQAPLSQGFNAFASDPVPPVASADAPNAEEEVVTVNAAPETAIKEPPEESPLSDKSSASVTLPLAAGADLGAASETEEEDPHLLSEVEQPIATVSKEVSTRTPIVSEQKVPQRVGEPLKQAEEKPPVPGHTVTSHKSASLANVPHAALTKPVKKPLVAPRTMVQKQVLGGGFTVQLMGTNKASRAKHFIEQYSLHPQAQYYRTQRNGADWYVVTYGRYSDTATARAAIKSLPPTVRAQKPWVRSIKGLSPADG